jgi:hypothetical protein
MSTIFQWILDNVLLFIWGKVSDFISNYIKEESDDKSIENQATQDVTDLKNAQNEQEKEDEAKNLANHI